MSQEKSSRFLECKLSVCFRVRAEVSGTGKSSEKLRRLINDSHQRIYIVKVSARHVAWICKQQPESFRHYIHDEWLQMRSKIDNFGFLHLAPRALCCPTFLWLSFGCIVIFFLSFSYTFLSFTIPPVFIRFWLLFEFTNRFPYNVLFLYDICFDFYATHAVMLPMRHIGIS